MYNCTVHTYIYVTVEINQIKKYMWEFCYTETKNSSFKKAGYPWFNANEHSTL